MSMISEQVRKIREYEKYCHNYNMSDFKIVFENAADTIEALSAKLAMVNMEWLERRLGSPIAVGDDVYILTSDSPDGIEETVCEKITFYSRKKIVITAPCRIDDWGDAKWNFKISQFGKRIFTTREAAEVALAQKSKGDENA